jgi:hypothetical protein
LLLYSSYLPLGVPNGLDIQLGTNSFLVPSSQQSLLARNLRSVEVRDCVAVIIAVATMVVVVSALKLLVVAS